MEATEWVPKDYRRVIILQFFFAFSAFLRSSNLTAHLCASWNIRKGRPFGRYRTGNDQRRFQIRTLAHDVIPNASLQYATISSRPFACPTSWTIISPLPICVCSLPSYVFTFLRKSSYYVNNILIACVGRGSTFTLCPTQYPQQDQIASQIQNRIFPGSISARNPAQLVVNPD